MTAVRADNAALALLNQDGGIAAELRSALQAFGANVVYEASLQDLDRAQLKSSGARIVVINLGDNEDALDDLEDLLDSSDYEIIVNDSAVSAQLRGSDQARWVRHLAAKILRRPEIVLPPRPAGAVAPPTFEQHWAARVPVAEVIGESPAADKSASAAATALTGAAAVPANVSSARPAIEEPTTAAEQAHAEEAHLEQALANVEILSVAAQPEVETDSLEDADFARALENFDAAASATATPDVGVDDLDALLIAAHGADALQVGAEPDRPTRVTREVEPEELQDLDFNSIDAALTADVAPEEKATPVRDATAKRAPAATNPKVAAPDWSLAPAEESSLMSVADAAKEFGIEKVSAEAYLTPQVDEPATEPLDPKEIGAAIPRGFASLELEPLETEEDKKPKNTVVYDTGRDLELPTQAVKPPKRDDDANKAKEVNKP